MNRITWTPKVCRIIAFYGFWAIVLPTLGGLGMYLRGFSRERSELPTEPGTLINQSQEVCTNMRLKATAPRQLW